VHREGSRVAARAGRDGGRKVLMMWTVLCDVSVDGTGEPNVSIHKLTSGCRTAARKSIAKPQRPLREVRRRDSFVDTVQVLSRGQAEHAFGGRPDFPFGRPSVSSVPGGRTFAALGFHGALRVHIAERGEDVDHADPTRAQ
jgi:hypothetical protein